MIRVRNILSLVPALVIVASYPGMSVPQGATGPPTRNRTVASTATPAQDSPLGSCQIICITSPKDGTIVSPGQTITVEVQVKAGAAYSIALIGYDPIGISEIKTATPYTFSIQIPSKIESLGKRGITAIGKAASDQNTVFSPTIDLDIEERGTPTKLSSQTIRLYNMKVGDSFPALEPLAEFPDGSWIGIQESSFTKYSSSAPQIASVDYQGEVNAIAPGSATITIRYKTLVLVIPVDVVGGAFQGDVNGDGKVTVDDLNDILASMGVLITDSEETNKGKSVRATGPADPRDLNHDGVIDYNDVEIERHLIGKLADLSVLVQKPTTPGMVGTPLIFTLQLTNNGPDPTGATDLAITVEGLSSSGRPLAAPDYLGIAATSGVPAICTNSSFSAGSGIDINCKLTNLLSGESSNITLTIVPTMTENVWMEIVGRSTTPDPKLWNNRWRFWVPVNSSK